MEKLKEWLRDNNITYQIRGRDIVLIGDCKFLYQDMSRREHIFMNDKDGNTVFNACENTKILADDNYDGIVFQFGDKFYWYDIKAEKIDFKVLKYMGENPKWETDVKFYPLGIHTGFELLNGSGLVKDWIRKAKFYGYPGIGIADRNTMAATLELQKEATEAGLKYVFGYSLTIDMDDDKVGAIVYAITQKGFRNLLRIQKAINVDREDKMISLDEILLHSDGCVLVFDKWSGNWLSEDNEALQRLRNGFSDIYFQVDLSEYRADRIDSKVLLSIKAYFDNFYSEDKCKYGIEPVLIQDSYYLDSDDWKNKIILNKVDIGAAHEQSFRQFMKSPDELWDEFDALFSDKYDEDLFYQMCENTCKIAESASAAYDLTNNWMPEYVMTDEEKEKYGTNHNMYLQLIEEGFQKLTPKGMEEQYRKQIDYETYIIEETDNINYMLVNRDVVNWCRANDITVGVGRGSAGGALTLFYLGITKVDPLKYDLIFERFLLPERAGLEPDDVTVVADKRIKSDDYYSVTLEDGNTYDFDCDAKFRVERNGEIMEVYADELEVDDDIRFDNRTYLFTLKEI